MVERDRGSAVLAAFEQHLDIYGARTDRWPAATRQRYETLLVKEPRARSLMAEARALERLLDQEPVASSQTLANLTDRIMAAVDADTSSKDNASVVELSKVRAMRRAAPAQHGFRAGWRVVSALAASLILGIYLGSAPGVVTAVETVADTVGITSSTDDDLAFFDDNGSSLPEDLL